MWVVNLHTRGYPDMYVLDGHKDAYVHDNGGDSRDSSSKNCLNNATLKTYLQQVGIQRLMQPVNG